MALSFSFMYNSTVMKLLIMRHGETFWNMEGRLQGQTDIPLNEEGRKMAVSCGKGMKEIPVDLCISSSLSRATETAELVLKENREYGLRAARTVEQLRREAAAEKPGTHPSSVRLVYTETAKGRLPYITDDRLKEASFGSWEGLICKAEGYSVPLADFSTYWNDPDNPKIPPDVERLTHVVQRFEAALADIVSRKSLQDKTVLLVVHGCVMRAVMYIMSGRKEFRGKVPFNCEVITAEPEPDGGLREISREIWYDRSMIHDYYATMKQE